LRNACRVSSIDLDVALATTSPLRSQRYLRVTRWPGSFAVTFTVAVDVRIGARGVSASETMLGPVAGAANAPLPSIDATASRPTRPHAARSGVDKRRVRS
jgi:hypothetical protein